jgi:DNA adenine methylase
MTAYHGGKYRHGKKIAEIISKIYENTNDTINGYIEPFCGMCGVYRHVVDLMPKSLKYIASDNHKSLILMWKALQDGWKPPKDCSIEKYNKLKKYSIPSAERGYIGFTFGFGGQFFCGPHRRTYGANHIDKSKIISDLAKEMKHVKFSVKDFTFYTLDKFKNYIFYCDPPYENKRTTKYYDDSVTLQTFDSKQFWEWCRKMSKHNIVIISEYTAPNDFIPIFTFDSKRFNNKTTNTKVESLYMYNIYFN